MLLDEIGNCAEMEIILPEYHAIAAILSGNTARYIDHVACELRPICKEIGKRILFVCGRKNLAEKKEPRKYATFSDLQTKEMHRRDILLHGIIPGRPPLRRRLLFAFGTHSECY